MYAMDVPTTKLTVLNPEIITIQHNEDRINIRSNHGADLVLGCPACVHLKAAVKNLPQLILRWLAAHIASSVCARDEEQNGKKAQPQPFLRILLSNYCIRGRPPLLAQRRS
jgi:hypothetical protein